MHIEQLNIELYHLIAGEINPKEYQAWDLKLDIALPQIAIALGNMVKAQIFKKEYLNYLLDKNTFSYSTLFTIVARKV